MPPKSRIGNRSDSLKRILKKANDRSREAAKRVRDGRKKARRARPSRRR